jgi:hypothetical protein
LRGNRRTVRGFTKTVAGALGALAVIGAFGGLTGEPARYQTTTTDAPQAIPASTQSTESADTTLSLPTPGIPWDRPAVFPLGRHG